MRGVAAVLVEKEGPCKDQKAADNGGSTITLTHEQNGPISTRIYSRHWNHFKFNCCCQLLVVSCLAISKCYGYVLLFIIHRIYEPFGLAYSGVGLKGLLLCMIKLYWDDLKNL